MAQVLITISSGHSFSTSRCLNIIWTNYDYHMLDSLEETELKFWAKYSILLAQLLVNISPSGHLLPTRV